MANDTHDNAQTDREILNKYLDKYEVKRYRFQACEDGYHEECSVCYEFYNERTKMKGHAACMCYCHMEDMAFDDEDDLP